MLRTRRLASAAAIVGVLALAFGLIAAGAGNDFGQQVTHDLDAKSQQLFGVNQGLDASMTTSIDAATASADPNKLATVAKGLKVARRHQRPAAPNLDMIALWPNDSNPEWIIACNEQGHGPAGPAAHPHRDGLVETIVTGTTELRPTRRTPWGTILFGEEAGGGPTGGGVYELIDPLADHRRDARPRDRDVLRRHRARRTSSRARRSGGCRSRARHLPERRRLLRRREPPVAARRRRLLQVHPDDAARRRRRRRSPVWTSRRWSAGSDLRPASGQRSGNTDYGQGSNTGLRQWIPIPTDRRTRPARAGGRAQADRLLPARGHRHRPRRRWRPGKVRFCGNNTGNESRTSNYGETICITRRHAGQAVANTATPEVQLLRAWAARRCAMLDNIAYQPGRGNWVLHEDADTHVPTPHNNDLWDCLPDGAGRRPAERRLHPRSRTLNDLTAEWTGGIFDATGTHFYVSIQHNMTGNGVILDITGWK